jgi:hypothetical protein
VKKTLLLTAILLLSVTWVVAQSNPNPQPPSGNNAPTGSSGQMDPQSSQGSQGAQGENPQGTNSGMQLQGCLSGTSGNYMITDSSGATYQLQGEESQLSKNVGKEVRLSGTAAPSSGSNTGSAQMFNVTKVRKVANACSNAGAAPSK